MVKSKNGTRLGNNLNAGTMTNNNLYEEMEVPQGLGPEVHLSYEKDMKLSNGQRNQGFFFYCLLKNNNKK